MELLGCTEASREALCALVPPAQPWAPCGHLALARPLRCCQGHTVPVSQDLGSTDLKRERLYLVCQIIRVGRMDLRDSHSRKLSTGLRRPFGISGGGGLHADPQGLLCHHPGTPPATTSGSVMSLGHSHCPFSLPADPNPLLAAPTLSPVWHCPCPRDTTPC